MFITHLFPSQHPQQLLYRCLYLCLICVLFGCQSQSLKQLGKFHIEEDAELYGGSMAALERSLTSVDYPALDDSVTIEFKQFNQETGLVVLYSNQPVNSRFTRTCRVLLERISIEVFNHKPLNLEVMNEKDKVTLEVTYEERVALGKVYRDGDVTGYSRNSPVLVKRVLAFLRKNDPVSLFDIGIVQLNKSQDRIKLHIVVPDALEKNPSLANELRYLSFLISQNLAKNTPVDLYICDEAFSVHRVIRYGE